MAFRLWPRRVRTLTADDMKAVRLAGERVCCYWRANGSKAVSGYPSLEWGYCLLSPGKDMHVVAKQVLGEVADIVELVNVHDGKNLPVTYLTIDPTADGYWRVIGDFVWEESLAEYMGCAQLRPGPSRKESYTEVRHA
jgi:hypothetical protein